MTDGMLDIGDPPPSRETLQKAVKRELGYRHHVYPRRIAAGRMKADKARDETKSIMQH